MRLVTVLIAAPLMVGCSSATVPGSPISSSSPTVSVTAAVTPTPSAPANVCHGLAHVYNPGRLRVLAPCVSVRGVVVSVRQEPDGDLHVLLRVDVDQHDPRGGRFTNGLNDARQSGDLVLEPVCVGPVIQPDAVSACGGYHNPLLVPPPGTRVVATGPWVLDAPHGWLELHPLEKVEVLA